MFKLLRYFSIASLMAFLVVLLVLGLFYRQISRSQYQALDRARLEVTAARDQALVRLQAVVLDMQLPGASGLEIFRAMRADARLDETRVIVATANPQHIEARREEVDLVLVKPLSVAQLRALAERLKPGQA